MVLFYQSIVNAIQHLTLTEAVKIKVTVFLLQRECLAFRLQEQPPCFIGLVHRCQQTGLVLFVEGVYVAEIEQIVIVVLGLRHTADTTDGLNLKLLAHTLTKLHEDFGPWAIPAGTDGLFHKQKNGLRIILCEVFRQITLVFAHPDADHTVVVGITHALQLAFHSTDCFRLTVGELNQHERTDDLALRQHFLIPGGDGLAFGIGQIEKVIVIVRNFYIVLDALIDIQGLCDQPLVNNIQFINSIEFISLVFHSRCANTNDILGGEMIYDIFGLCRIVGMLLIDNYNEIHAAAVRFGNAVIQILTFAVFNGCVTLFRNKLPVDESSAFCREPVPECIK